MSSKTDNISTQQWALLQQIFEQALELPEDKRAAYVDNVCDGDASLKNQVNALIVAAESDQELVGSLIRTAADSVLESSNRTRTKIGAFKVIDTIGVGGMGVVYLGQRDGEFHQQVAIKILHDDMANEVSQLRFRTERQILADLNHPNIARLLDGGRTEDGQPYLVMEYIDGEPIVEYCDRNRLSIEARLDMFIQVCSAVATAHRSLVVHRDIKPSNILVGADGVPKLLDFGIAKVLKNRLRDVDLATTQLGDRLLTPDNASPEQIQGSSITTSSDIYSLGVLLYQLLCGSRPFRLVDKTPAEMEQIILEQQPSAPSQTIGTLGKADSATQRVAAQRRRTSSEKLRRRLRGDLDNITLMALRKEPHRRYASASQFASDIKRHLRGLPIVAGKDTRVYHALKFAERNKASVTVAGLFLMALVTFSIATYVQAQKLAKEKLVSDKAVEFLTEVFESSDPQMLQKANVTALDLVDVGAQKMSQELGDQPELQARLERTIGLAYFTHGNTEKAYKHLNSALVLRTEVYGDDHPYVADVLENLGNYYMRMGNSVLAEQNFLKALAIFQNSVSDKYFKQNRAKHQAAISTLLVSLSFAETRLSKWVDAEKHLQESLRIAETLEQQQVYQHQLPYVLSELGSLYQRQGAFKLSEEYLTRAVNLATIHYGENHSYVASYTRKLAVAVHSIGDLDRAEKLYRSSLAIADKVFTDENPMLLSHKISLARLLFYQEDFQTAHSMLSDVVAIHRQNLGDGSSLSFGDALIELARTKTMLDKYQEAEALFVEASNVYRETVGPDSSLYASTRRYFGNLRVRMGQPQESLLLYDEAITTLLRGSYSEHWMLAACRSEKAEALLVLGNWEEAEVLLTLALPVLNKTLGNEHRLYLQASERMDRVVKLRRSVAVNN